MKEDREIEREESGLLKEWKKTGGGVGLWSEVGKGAIEEGARGWI